MALFAYDTEIIHIFRFQPRKPRPVSMDSFIERTLFKSQEGREPEKENVLETEGIVVHRCQRCAFREGGFIRGLESDSAKERLGRHCRIQDEGNSKVPENMHRGSVSSHQSPDESLLANS